MNGPNTIEETLGMMEDERKQEQADRTAAYVANIFASHKLSRVLARNIVHKNATVPSTQGDVELNIELTYVGPSQHTLTYFEFKDEADRGFHFHLHRHGSEWCVRYFVSMLVCCHWSGHRSKTTREFQGHLANINKKLTTPRHTHPHRATRTPASTPARVAASATPKVDIAPLIREREEVTRLITDLRTQLNPVQEQLNLISSRRTANARRLQWIKAKEAELDAMPVHVRLYYPPAIRLQTEVESARARIKHVDDAMEMQLRTKVDQLSLQLRQHEAAFADLDRRIKEAQR